MSRARVEVDRSDPDHIYYNVSIINDSPNFVAAYVNQTRTTNIIDKANEYRLAVVRFKIPTLTVPIFVFPTINGNPNIPNNNFYSITLSYLGVDYLRYIIYQQQDFTGGIPTAIFDYNQFINMINSSILLAFNAIPVKPSISTTPPIVMLNTSTKCLEIMASIDYSDVYPYNNPTKIHLYFNQPLYYYFEGLDSMYYNPGQPNGKDVLIPFYTTGNNSTITSVTMSEPYSSLNLWNTLRSIVILSDYLPIQSEAIENSNQQGNISRKILTDFEPLIQDLADARSYQQYYAQLYRYVDLVSSDSIRNVDLNFSWSDNLGNVRQLYLAPRETITIKLMFEKKY